MPRKTDQQQAVAILRRLKSEGFSLREAAEVVGVSWTTLREWDTKQSARGTLADQRRTASGRKPLFDLTAEEEMALKHWVLQKETLEVAVHFFVRDERCRAGTRAAITKLVQRAAEREAKPQWPRSLRRAARVTALERAMERGPKARQQAMPAARRSNIIIWPDGTSRPMGRDDVWMADDYSSNQPFQLINGDLGRQTISYMDAGSRRWLNFSIIGKGKDVYTSEDCLACLWETMLGEGGMPRALVLEKGRWRGNALRGVPLVQKNDGGEDSDDDSRRWGGIDGAGLILHYTHSSRGKTEIESGFNILQRFLRHSGEDIGRFRGEMELATKKYLAVQAGRREALRNGFLSAEDALRLHTETMELLNNRPKQFGYLDRHISPNALAAEMESGLQPLPTAEAWRFTHWFKRNDVVVKAGKITVRHQNLGVRELEFTVNHIEEGIALEDGHRVFVAYDPLDPAKGCVVANRETGVRNRHGWPLGKMLVPCAPCAGFAPAFDFSGNASAREGLKSRKRELAGYLRMHQKIARPDGKASRRAVKLVGVDFSVYQAELPHGKKGLRVSAAETRDGDRLEATTGRATPPAEIPADPAAAPLPEMAREASRIPAKRSDGRSGVMTAPTSAARPDGDFDATRETASAPAAPDLDALRAREAEASLLF